MLMHNEITPGGVVKLYLWCSERNELIEIYIGTIDTMVYARMDCAFHNELFCHSKYGIII